MSTTKRPSHKRCIHDRQLRYCKECENGGYGLCKHDKRPHYCKECGGKGVCCHGKQKHWCKTCSSQPTPAYCEHDKRQADCTVCRPLNACEHRTRKRECIICTLSIMCKHLKSRFDCSVCSPKERKRKCIHERRYCSICFPKRVFHAYEEGAKERGYSFELTLEQFTDITSRPCYYCGDQEKPRGVDRWENSLGYTINNSVPCCKTCNFMKVKMSGLDFIKQARRIAKWVL
jgi:hypothetical protein